MAEYRLTLEERPGYLYALAEGERTAENMTRFLGDVHEACQRLGRTAALIEVGLEGPSLGIGTIYGIITARAPTGVLLNRIAYVERSAGKNTGAQFAVDVAVNRGVNLRMFATAADARRWIEAP